MPEYSINRGLLRVPGVLGCAAFAVAASLASCGGGTTTMVRCPGTDPNSQQQCMVSNDPGVAVGHAVLAGGAWVAGGGCNVNGCLPPLHCNGESGLCERITCNEGRDCPSSTECDLESHTCR